MNYNYYHPYWSNENYIEHYGVKGMTWGKRRSSQELKGTKFKDARVLETLDYLTANPISISNPLLIMDEEVKKVKSTVRKVERSVKLSGKIKVRNINNSITNAGTNFINRLLSIFKKK